MAFWGVGILKWFFGKLWRLVYVFLVVYLASFIWIPVPRTRHVLFFEKTFQAKLVADAVHFCVVIYFRIYSDHPIFRHQFCSNKAYRECGLIFRFLWEIYIDTITVELESKITTPILNPWAFHIEYCHAIKHKRKMCKSRPQK
jgi:hypothetical protein